MRRRQLLIGWLPLACLALAPSPTPARTASASTVSTARGVAPPARDSCVVCHSGIEEIHPGYALTCIDCHGGDATCATKEQAHVQPSRPVPGDERVLPIDWDLSWQRFRNPSNLRVAEQVCGICHRRIVRNVTKSLHATTTGHLGDGFYENGLVKSKRPSYSVFPVRDEDGHVPPEAIAATEQVPPFHGGQKDKIATHYADLPRKACMQCHLWSEGRAVRGRLGLDGDYRGQGCAACHVTYGDDGRSHSRDATIDKLEPGHPLQHRFTTRIPTDTCTRCHYGDASIGLWYRGLAQLVPGQPAGPQVPGTTRTLQNGVFYVEDADRTPPDVHHERGMHCIDCHTMADTMGDGNIYPQMDHAVEIECESCHGTFDRVSSLMTRKGRRIPNLERDGDRFFLISKVTGKRHLVVQVKHLLDQSRPEYDAKAAAAMTPAHGRLECYACHSAWNVDFFGFHFDRNEQFTQLDLLSGQRTPGRVTTQEKVFATFNQLRLGFNHEGRIAPWIVGFATIGSAHDRKGNTILRQAAPKTQAGLSGVTMVPHQVHTTRAESRACVECHRSPATYGLGSSNFRLTREFAYAVSRTGFHTLAIDAKSLDKTQRVASLPLPDQPKVLAVSLDPIQGHGTHAYVAGADGRLTVLDLQNPVMPRPIARAKLLADPRRLLVAGNRLYAADGVHGLVILDIEKPASPKVLGTMPSMDARGLALAFPWLCVADGAAGLLIADVADPQHPRCIAQVDLNGESSAACEALDVSVLFQYSHPLGQGERSTRTKARLLAFVAAGLDGLRIVDFTEPEHPVLLEGAASRRVFRFQRGDVRGVAVNTVFDIGSSGGGMRSQERDYLYAFVEEGSDGNREQRVKVFDVSDPLRPLGTRRTDTRVYGGTGRLLLLRTYNAPFLQHFVAATGAGGAATLVNVTRIPSGASVAATWSGMDGITDLALEQLAFDRLQDEDGRPLKDVSHEDCRYLTRDEWLRVLQTPLPSQAPPLEAKK